MYVYKIKKENEIDKKLAQLSQLIKYYILKISS